MVFPEIPDTGNPYQITELEVFQLLDNIKTQEATSSLDFPSWLTKNNSHIMSKPITNIINAILANGYFPCLWKKAEVTPITKVKHPSKFKDMRPISLLFLGKKTERIISKQLRAQLPTMTHQYTYTPNMGTTDALMKFTSDIIDKLDDKESLGVRSLMLDFSKAFD